MTTQLLVRRADWQDAFEFMVIDREGGKVIGVAQQVIMDIMDHKDDWPAMVVPPTFVLSRDMAQMAMDQLWDAGLRPANVEDSAAVRKVMQFHIDDIREDAEWMKALLGRLVDALEVDRSRLPQAVAGDVFPFPPDKK